MYHENISTYDDIVLELYALYDDDRNKATMLKSYVELTNYTIY